MLISDSYRELNRQMHEAKPSYGTSGRLYAQFVRSIMSELGTADVLDYGCGKRTLQAALGQPITNYDPCLPEYSLPPRPHEIVVCTDVLEHLEPDCVEDVLAELRRLTRQVCFLTINMGPAMKHLPDGRNAHLIQEGEDWWLPRLRKAGFTIRPDHIHRADIVGHTHKELLVAATPTRED